MQDNRTELSVSTEVLEKMAELAALEVEGVEALLEHRCLGLVHLVRTTLLNQLVKSRHVFPPLL